GKKHRIKVLAQEWGTVKQVAQPFIRSILDDFNSFLSKL
ncbi:HK97-gp10 family putative phage morphogenesis protein, partial [Klebsiella pneumoniae]